MNQGKVLDYLDIELTIEEPALAGVQQALADFCERHNYVEIAPRLQGTTLHINSTDLIALLGYWDSQSMAELEQQRLKKSISAAFEQLLLRCTDLNRRAHYKWCLAALKNLPWGRYRDLTP